MRRQLRFLSKLPLLLRFLQLLCLSGVVNSWELVILGEIVNRRINNGGSAALTNCILLIERPPIIYRMLFPEGIWRVMRKGKGKTVYLTFDDGPVPTVTPWVLEMLDRHDIKATFFCVGENVERYPWLFEEILRRGHAVGNHTYNHLQGRKVSALTYCRNVMRAHKLIRSNLFRPPHGMLSWKQMRILHRHFNIIMYDLVTRDYSRKLNGEQVLANVKRYARRGSIIVFHDSVKAEANMKYALPRAIEWLKEKGYSFGTL